MSKGLINVVYVVLNYIFNDSFHRLQVTCLRPMLIQLYAYLIYRVLQRPVLWPVRWTTNDMMPTLTHGLVHLGSPMRRKIVVY